MLTLAPMPPRPALACRQIRDADLPAVAGLLGEGFPSRTPAYWRDGLQRLARHATPAGLPRLGWLLAAGGVPVGVLLLIHAAAPDGGLLCNISSWYVRPEWRAYAALLNQRAVRNDAVTYVNISPAPHTLATIEALGFARARAGLFAGMPALSHPGRGVAIGGAEQRPRSGAALAAADAALLAAHARFGCLGLWVEAADGVYPFVFRRRVLRRGLPCAMLIHAPSHELLERFAGPLGRALARRGLPVLLAGAERALRGIAGRHFPDRLAIYSKGGAPPPSCDLSYTEAAIFGM